MSGQSAGEMARAEIVGRVAGCAVDFFDATRRVGDFEGFFVRFSIFSVAQVRRAVSWTTQCTAWHKAPDRATQSDPLLPKIAV